MPFKSKAQMRWMFANENKGEVPKGTAEEWAKKTKNIKNLPEKVEKDKMEKESELRREIARGYFEKKSFIGIGTGIGGLLGALMANKGHGWEGAGLGALKGLGTDLGAQAGSYLTSVPGAIGGGVLGGVPGALIGGTLTGLPGLAVGGFMGYKATDALMKKLISEKLMKDTFGD